MSDPLRELGTLVAERQDRALEQQGVVGEVVRRTLAVRNEKSTRRRPRVMLAAAAMVLIGLVLYVVIPRGQDRDVAATAAPSTLVAAGEDHAHAFADGTTLLLSAGSRAEIAEVTRQGGRVELVEGNVRVSVPPNQGRRWAFIAGPYTVEVKGTRFDLGWSPSAGRFDLTMFDGSVRVSGPGADSRLVVAGQSLMLHESGVASAAPEATATATAADPPLPHVEPSAPPSMQPPSARSASADRPSWQPLALEGKYAEAMKLAEDAGFDSVVAKSSASELLLLGDACRFAGRSARASEAYEAVRKRHAGGLEARRALFSLGVLAFPGKAAVPFFEQYLSEAPGGPLAPEALGRILEIRSRGGETDAAKKLATQYLAQYPKGAHARLAQSIIDDAEP